MTNINPINVNTQGVAGGYIAREKLLSGRKEDIEAQGKEIAARKEQLSADAVLNYLAQSAAVAAPKKLDPAQYVDKASADRIAGFMADFEDQVAQGLAAFALEFPEASPEAGQAVVLAKLNKEA